MFRIGKGPWRMTRKAFEAWEARVSSEGGSLEARHPLRPSLRNTG